MLTLGALPRAEAFSVESLVSDGCHERITIEAITAEGWPDAVSPVGLSAKEQLIVQGLPVGLADKILDSLTLALVIGCRDNDLEGVRPNDLTALSKLHADPQGQEAHCLRGPEDDGPTGDVTAIKRCREFILEELSLASRSAEMAATSPVSVWLAFDGQVNVELSRFGFHLGRALHTLQDSFSHCFRSSDGLRIQHVLNYVDWAQGDDATLEKDGYPHLSTLDLCDGRTAPRRKRVAMALEASRALLLAVKTKAPEQRSTRIKQVLDRYLSYQPGCTAANDFCDAPEQYETAGCGCRAAPERPGALAGGLIVLLAIWAWRRRSGARKRVNGVLLLALLCASQGADADQLTATATRAVADQAMVAPETPLKTTSPAVGNFALHLALGGALDEGALVFGLGLRWRPTARLSAGITVEYNPWFSTDAVRLAPGALNIYASVAWRWINLAPLDLRTTAHAGVSALLFDMVSAEAGSVGPYFGLSLLGIALHLGPHWNILLEPADGALPIPSVQGVPGIYLPYRFTAAVLWVF